MTSAFKTQMGVKGSIKGTRGLVDLVRVSKRAKEMVLLAAAP